MVRLKRSWLVIRLCHEDLIQEDEGEIGLRSQLQVRRINDELFKVDFTRVIRERMKFFFGSIGESTTLSSIKEIYSNVETATKIVKVNKAFSEMIMTSLCLTSYINDIKVHIHVLHSGATVKQCEKYMVKRHMERV